MVFKLKNTFKHNQGFTLIEVLIAITILSFISLFTYKMIDQSTDTKERVTKEDQLLIQSLTAINRIDADFSQAYSPLYFSSKNISNADGSNPYTDAPPPGKNFDGVTKNGHLIPQIQSEDKSSFTFMSAANRRKISDSKESRYTWIKYSLKKNEQAPTDQDENKTKFGEFEIIRQIISTNIYRDDINWSEVKGQVILSNVKTLEFSFYDERTKKYVSSIQDLNENRNAIRSIKTSITWIDYDGNEQKIDKTFRVLMPYYNSKLDDAKLSGLQNNGAYGGSVPPPNIPDPNQANEPGDGIVQ